MLESPDEASLTVGRPHVSNWDSELRIAHRINVACRRTGTPARRQGTGRSARPTTLIAWPILSENLSEDVYVDKDCKHKTAPPASGLPMAREQRYLHRVDSRARSH